LRVKVLKNGGLAQLARALDLHSRGQGFDSLILHKLDLRDHDRRMMIIDKKVEKLVCCGKRCINGVDKKFFDKLGEKIKSRYTNSIVK
jgi:hypothetical protein